MLLKPTIWKNADSKAMIVVWKGHYPTCNTTLVGAHEHPLNAKIGG